MLKLLDVPIWVVSTRKTGHVNQCLSLLDALGVEPNRTILIAGKSAADTRLRKLTLFFETLFHSLRGLVRNRAPQKFVIISSGRSATWLCRIWRWIRKSDVFIIHIGSTKVSASFANIFVTSNHDSRDREIDNKCRDGMILTIDGVLARKPEMRGRPDPVTSSARTAHLVVLIGGKNDTFDYDGPVFRHSIDQLKAVIDRDDCTTDVVFSRRTYERTSKLLRASLADCKCQFVDVADRAGYAKAMSGASHFVVCPDSITMISECCSLNRAVYVLSMDKVSADTVKTRLIEQFLDLGYVEKFDNFAWRKTTRTLRDQAKVVTDSIEGELFQWYMRR